MTVVGAGRKIMVDDSSPLIQYHGEWFTENTTSMDTRGNYGGIYNTTQHGTLHNASLTFHYNGTYFAVMGTNDVHNDTGTPDPQWDCFVDNIKVDSNPFKFYENNWWLCEPKAIFLDDGPHILTVNATPRSHPFWVDRIDYSPSANVNMEDKTVFVDHTDSEIQFGAGWDAQGETANITRQTGSKLNFFFYGISVSWFGYLVESPASGLGSWSIDDALPTTFPLRAISGDGPAQYNQEFFRTSDFPRGYHKLTVTYLGPSNTAPLILDYLVVRNVTDSGATGFPSDNNQNPKTGINTGAIVAGSLAALALILFSILLLIYLRKRRRATHTRDRRHPQQSTSNRIPRPFVSKYQESYASRPYDPHRSARRKSRRPYVPLSEDSGVQESLYRRSLSPTRQSEPVLVYDIIPLDNPQPSMAGPRVLVHEDSGLRNIPNSTEAEPLLEIPPSYTAG
ncbi:hypothetical protein BJ165DRAFT_1523884 [Panaeolus papilionaceus]|nr:hypothetical protein BJ165DRAFT_1523884 [Panaeolus papilionaceus]